MKTHPLYEAFNADWHKWQLAYDGGDEFIREYLMKLSDKESDSEYQARRAIAYSPDFAAAAIDDIKNAIFQRTADVHREGGPRSYQSALLGREGGVDLQHSTMGTFIGTEVLLQLLIKARVGILVDNYRELGTTVRDRRGKRPYLVAYRPEQIISWAPRKPVEGFTHLLLEDCVDTYDDEGFPVGNNVEYKSYSLIPGGGVLVKIYNHDEVQIEEVVLDMPKIPFTCLELPRSLMRGIANYQIALLNLESSDISFARQANFPFYYEFYNPHVDAVFNKGPGQIGQQGDAETAGTSSEREVTVGLTRGRRFPKGIEPPNFISPDPDILRVSMEKGEQLKEDIRLLVNLNLSSMNPRRQSADSKDKDSAGLESGLSFIGLVLQKGELETAEHWSNFEGDGEEPKITYPATYSLKTEEQRRTEASELKKFQSEVPSPTYRKNIAKRIVEITVGNTLTFEELQDINKEIDDADTLTADPKVILESHKAGLVDDKTASNALGFKGEEVIAQARKDRAERIRLTLEAQGGPDDAKPERGAPEFDQGEGEERERGPALFTEGDDAD